MSATLVRNRSFTPSIAHKVGGSYALPKQEGHDQVDQFARAALWAFALAASLSPGSLCTYVASGQPDFFPAAASTISTGETAAAKSVPYPPATVDMVVSLKTKGMPISGISDILGVERKTVYSWLDDGIEANTGNYERLSTIYDLFAGEIEGSLKFFQRFWERRLPEGETLRQILTAPQINTELAHRSLASLRPAVKQAMESEIARKSDKHRMTTGTLNMRTVG